MIECPACAGPTALGGGCATCNGTTEVTQEAFDAFMIQKATIEETMVFWNNVQQYMYKSGSFKFEAGEKLFELNN
jgi:hypothetical protein